MSGCPALNSLHCSESHCLLFSLSHLHHYHHDHQVKLTASINLGVGDARGVMVIVVGNGHSDTSSNPG